MSRHPAPDELLLDYAAGVLPEGPALAVALHVALDPASPPHGRAAARRGRRAARERGGRSEMGEAALEQALARLDSVPVEALRAPVAARPGRPAGFEWAPAPLRPYLAGKDWKRVFGGFDEIRLDLHGDTHRVSLLRLEPGQGLPIASPRRRRIHRRAAGRLHRQHRQLWRRRLRRRAGPAATRADRRSRRALHRADRGRKTHRADRCVGAPPQPFVALGLDVTHLVRR